MASIVACENVFTSFDLNNTDMKHNRGRLFDVIPEAHRLVSVRVQFVPTHAFRSPSMQRIWFKQCNIPPRRQFSRAIGHKQRVVFCLEIGSKHHVLKRCEFTDIVLMESKPKGP